MNSWVIGLIIRLLEKMLTPEMIEEAKIKFCAWLWEMVQNPETEIDDVIFRAICFILAVDPEQFMS